MKTAVATKAERKWQFTLNMAELAKSLTSHGFKCFDAYYQLPQGESCFDKAARRWISPRRATSPARFIFVYEGIEYLARVTDGEYDTFILTIWTLHRSTTMDGTLREIHEPGYEVGTRHISVSEPGSASYKVETEAWENMFYQWFEAQHRYIKDGYVKCDICGNWEKPGVVGSILGTRTFVCPMCAKTYKW